MTNLYVAQINIGRIKAALDDPLMAGFVARLDEINALADRSPGFVWRLQTPEGNATYLRPYDDRIGDRKKLCGISADIKALEVDHIIPRSKGGTDDVFNWVWLF